MVDSSPPWVVDADVNAVFAAPDTYTSLEILLALYAFTLQLYADFSGYSDIALGVALLFGVTLPRNFALPYASTSVVEFWNRYFYYFKELLSTFFFMPAFTGMAEMMRNT